MTAFHSFRVFRKTIRTTYKEAFRLWAQGEVNRWRALHPDRIPFPLADFDGCTVGLDICLPCCLVHDIGVYYARSVKSRTEADDELFRCVVSIGDDEDRFGGVWNVIGWGYWAAVRSRTKLLALTGKLT